MQQFIIHFGNSGEAVRGIRVVPSSNPVTLTINPTPADATVELIAEGFTQIGNSITVEEGTVVSYTVSKYGYETYTGNITVKESEEISINMVLADKFKFTINSGSDSAFILPMSSRFGFGTAWSLDIDWGDGTQTIGSTGKSSYSTGTGVTHAYPEANKDYQITLSGDVGFLKQFGFYNNTSGCNVDTNKAKMKSLDSAFTLNMFTDNETSVGTLFCAYMFENCPNLTMNDEFNLPQNITSVGTLFCAYMFKNCPNLTMNDEFNLPPSLETSGDYFCTYMFQNCTSLTMNSVFNLPQNITTQGSNFCQYMFNGCTNLTMNDEFNLPQNITSVGNNFCWGMFSDCSSLTMNDEFNLPQNITSVGDRFCSFMFQFCKSITTGVKKFFGDLILSQDELDKTGVFSQVFALCSAITEELSPETVPMLTVVPTSSNNCFMSASDIATKYVPTNWGGQGIVKCIFTINATPSDATITINGVETNSITVDSGTTVNYTVSKDGYITVSESIVVNDNQIVNITMYEPKTFSFTVDTTKYSSTNTTAYAGLVAGTYEWLVGTPLTIDWGDNTQTVITDGIIDSTNITHNYATTGTYQITITCEDGYGRFPEWNLYDGGYGFYYPMMLMSIDSDSLPTLYKINGETIADVSSIFYRSTNLTTIPQNLFKENPQIEDFSSAFRYGGLTTIPQNLFQYNTKLSRLSMAFEQCKVTLNPIEALDWLGLNSESSYIYADGIFAGWSKTTNEYCNAEFLNKYYDKFHNYTAAFSQWVITEVPSNILDSFTEIEELERLFFYCPNLTTIPQDLFKYNTKLKSVEYMFLDCNALKNQSVYLYSTKITNAYKFGESGFNNVVYVPSGSTTYTTFTSDSTVGWTVATY